MNESVGFTQTERAEEEHDAMTDFIGVLGGFVVILASQLAFFLSGMIASWIALSAFNDFSTHITFLDTYGLPIVIILVCGILTAGLVATFWLLPISSEYMNISLMRAAGLTLISLPLLPIGGYVLSGGVRGYFLGYDLIYWFVFPIIGLVFLFHPELNNRWKLGDNRDWVLLLSAALLGLLSSVLFLHGLYNLPSVESSGENFLTPFSLVGATAGLVILVHSVLMPFLPNVFGMKKRLL